eukprot:6475731-Amphidinium_carterae.2
MLWQFKDLNLWKVLALAQDDAAPQSIAAHVVPVTYVALSVEEHSGLLEQLLSRAMDAMRCSAGAVTCVTQMLLTYVEHVVDQSSKDGIAVGMTS